MRIAQWFLALVFAVAAGLKLAALPRGVDAGTMFGALPPLIQWTVVGVELLLAVWLASGLQPRWSAFATVVLLSGFLAAILLEMGRPDPLSCGCFGRWSASLWITLIMDGVLLLMALGIYYRAPSMFKKR